MIKAIVILLLIASTASAVAQREERVTIAFYNVENLFDTIDDPRTDDHDFTPHGAYRWDTDKYTMKISNTVRVMDDIGADIIGMAEVESETAVKDLMRAMGTSYNYIFRQTSDRRGISQVLLFRASVFSPVRIWQARGKGLSREPLVVEGELDGEKVTVIVCHLPSKMNENSYRSAAARSLRRIIDGVRRKDPGVKLLVMGDFNDIPSSANGRTISGSDMINPFLDDSRKGYGTYSYRDRRYLYDQILLSDNFTQGGTISYDGVHGIFSRTYMFPSQGARQGYPKRSIERGTYTEGFSDHLPVLITVKKQR